MTPDEFEKILETDPGDGLRLAGRQALEAWRIDRINGRSVCEREQVREARLAVVERERDEWRDRARAAEDALAEMTPLLNEWLETPFFETRDEWERWVADFRPRVEGALQRAMFWSPPTVRRR